MEFARPLILLMLWPLAGSGVVVPFQKRGGDPAALRHPRLGVAAGFRRRGSAPAWQELLPVLSGLGLVLLIIAAARARGWLTTASR